MDSHQEKLLKRNKSTAVNRASTGADKNCRCVNCDRATRKEYLQLRFPNGIVDWDELEKPIADLRMAKAEGLCVAERSIDSLLDTQKPAVDANETK